MVYGRISISIDLFYMIIYRICLSLAAQPSIIHSVKEKVIKCQVLCSSSLVLPAAGLLMGASDSRARWPKTGCQHLHSKPSWPTHTTEDVKDPRLTLSDFITVSLKIGIHHVAGSPQRLCPQNC